MESLKQKFDKALDELDGIIEHMRKTLSFPCFKV